MRRTRVKFCGVTAAADAQAAASLGADAVGLVLYEPAAAALNIAEAAAVARAVPPFVDVVALFVNAEKDFVEEAVQRLRPSLLQFHGDEPAGYCRAFAVPYIKACRVRSAEDISRTMREHEQARGLLLDSHVAGTYGGSGRVFDWKLIPPHPAVPLIVAGGLSAEAVGEVIIKHRPWAVDVSSGIAREGDKRRKSFDKMQSFMREVKNANG